MRGYKRSCCRFGFIVAKPAYGQDFFCLFLSQEAAAASCGHTTPLAGPTVG
jgi:hypothetical protein